MLRINQTVPQRLQRCVHQLVEEQIINRGGEPAVASTGQEFTYAQLGDLSSRLAYRLVSMGVTTETCVPYCMDKSPWAVVVMLAILKAGGACVALDPKQPSSRLQSILDATGADMAVADAKNVAVVEGLTSTVLRLSPTLWAELQRHEDHLEFIPQYNPNALAFVNFTSGSTGIPKGIALEHASLCTSIQHHAPALSLNSETRALQFCSYTFDISVAEIFSTLSVGGCVCVLSEHERLNSLAPTASLLGVNWAYVTPTVASLFAPGDIPTLRTLCLGGEPILYDLTQRWIEHVRLFATSGPAECSVTCAGEEVLQPCAGSMGRAYGALIWLVDPKNHNKLAPLGAPGEIVVEGPGVARGYLNADAEANASFIVDPAWASSAHVPGLPASGRRMYKTGDIARMNLNGTLRTVGRKGIQVKVHGQRVELSEVEHHIASAAVARHVIVSVPTRGCWKDQLVAIVTPADTPTRPSTTIVDTFQLLCTNDCRNLISQLRRFMEDRVPEYMLPRTWVCLDYMPVTANGKLDRREALNWLNGADDATHRAVVDLETANSAADQPKSATQLQLQRAWSHVLNVEPRKIGITQSFYSLGGDSITAIQVASSLRAEGSRVTVQAILKYRTIESIASTVEHIATTASTTDETASVEEIDVRFPLSPIQTLHFYQMPEGQNHFNQSFLLKVKGKYLEANIVLSALHTIIQKHAMLRARFCRLSSGTWSQIVTGLETESLDFQSILAQDWDGVKPILEAASTGLDITSGPLFSARLIRLENKEQYLFLAIHHLVVDLVSWRVILEDIDDVIRHGSVRNPPTMSFQSWVRSQWAHVNHPQSQATFEPGRVLPLEISKPDLDYWGVENAGEYGTSLRSSWTLDQPTTAALLTEANHALNTESVEIMMSAFLYAFSQVFADRDLPIVFCEGHGREPWSDSIDISRTVGWFTTMWPVAVNGPSDDLFHQVRAVKDARRRLPGKGWPYFTARYFHPESSRSFADHEKVEILFNYLGQYQQLERGDSVFEQASAPPGIQNVDPRSPRTALFEINCVVEQGALVCSFSYSPKLRHQHSIKGWLDGCKGALEQTIHRLLQQPHPAPTLCDFSLVPFHHTSLDAFFKACEIRLGPQLARLDNIEDIYPCSPMQRGILSSQARRSEVYTVRQTWKVLPRPQQALKSLDVAQLQRACSRVIARHQMLRTVFIESDLDGHAYLQVVLRDAPTSIPVVEGDIKSHDQMLVIDLAEGMPYRLSIHHDRDGQVFLQLDINHAASDGMSTKILVRDIIQAYDDTLDQGPAPLFRDFISHVESQDKEASLRYWSQLLEDADPCHFPQLIPIPPDAPRFVNRDFSLPRDLAARVYGFCRKHHITVASFIRVVWAVVLRAYVGTDRVCYGYLSSGRNVFVPRVDDIYGPLIAILVCRVELDGNVPVAEILQTMHEQSLQSLEHQHISLAEIQHAAVPGRGALFNTVVNVQRRLETQDGSYTSQIILENVSGYDPSEVRRFSVPIILSFCLFGEGCVEGVTQPLLPFPTAPQTLACHLNSGTLLTLLETRWLTFVNSMILR